MAKEFLTGNQAFAHAALEAGVRVCAGYPGTPSSEVIETVAAQHAAGKAQGVHVEWSTNEKAALELLAGASYAGARTLFTCKQVGLNVASDALMSLNYVGVKGGMVLYVADDPGPISSQTEQDTRRFAAFAKVPVFDPATPEQGCEMMAEAYDLSERYGTPVIMRPTTRICHASTFVDVAETTTARQPEGFKKDSRWVIFPKRAYEAHGEINERLPKIADDFSKDPLVRFNPMFEAEGSADKGLDGSTGNSTGNVPRLGIMAGGISYAYAREALRQIEQQIADGKVMTADGVVINTLPAYRVIQIGTPYPFPAARAAEFAEGLDEVIVFEELDHVLEDEMLKLAGKIHASYDVKGKLTGHTTNRGENSIDVIAEQLRDFFGLKLKAVSASIDSAVELSAHSVGESSACQNVEPSVHSISESLVCPIGESSTSPTVEPPARPPLLCPGCPHRGSFYATKAAFRRASDGIFCGDIGCYTLGNAKPLDAVDTCLCMGADITIAQGFSIVEPNKKALAFIGDSTFFASGMTGVANAVYNQHDITIVVLDNATTAMTGSQPHPGTGVTLMGPKSEPISIEMVLRALGVKVITHANPLHLDDAVAAAKEAIEYDGPSAIIYESPCIKLIKPAAPVRVDLEACTNCGRCVLKLGCPALSWDAENRHPVVDVSLCNGCGLCTYVCNDGALICDELNEGALQVPKALQSGASEGSLPEAATFENSSSKDFRAKNGASKGSTSQEHVTRKEAPHD